MNRFQQYLEILFAFHALCSLICAMTPTRKDDSFVGYLYRFLEAGALLIGRAKDR